MQDKSGKLSFEELKGLLTSLNAVWIHCTLLVPDCVRRGEMIPQMPKFSK